MRFAKGHGTGNDFIVVPDTDGELELTAPLARALCDRRTGLGADGVLRIAPGHHAPAAIAGNERARAATAGPRWFMDYRNADGSVAEMCGNGVRVFVRYLIDAGLDTGPEVLVATRAGVRAVRDAGGGQLSVDMGAVQTGGPGWAVIGGRKYHGLAVRVGNPHLACIVAGPLAGLDLSRPPEFDAGQFPNGVNIELIRVAGERQIEMRVHERGSGATMSCGTGAVAAAVAAATDAGVLLAEGRAGTPPSQWTVDVPGGRLQVTADPAASILTGPAVIVAEGEVRPDWLAARSSPAVG